MGLKKYKEKRNFGKTKEPPGPKSDKDVSQIKVKKELIYVIQKHLASHLHYDLRLEMAGVLKSWAVPKEPPTDPQIKRLAVAVEDHPLGYENFQGIIPEGQYGAGIVEIWDKGTYRLVEKSKNSYVVDIDGQKLKGIFYLVKLKPGIDKKNWLFFKGK